ncbi:N-alpha-acetyltransferase 35, NatC auxiliary subunit homolog [Bactrocera neohumeralis]|uniref:N-alpha-acetyltransferase 35, NatC auxiliary subunit homolog n=1 Tax=Bactrocera tryoni TaxID=59916 RepID=UPI001A972AEC|nr:N-alpha-acetyltransferase 35, NatC auxiliary subunit homolog [Bactrocera tryoni]XP_050323262.1 N-alpha-acetyltransferase 35, NatC auxiliary subunit homolog [Bactrocera neohumeralis]
MDHLGNAVFQAASAAAAAAAALQNKPDDFVMPELYDANQWAMEEGGFIDSDIQRNVRSNEDTGEYPRFGWVDITKEFFDSCSELNLGELAQDMLFGLFEAMSAIEMMDPKMDVGMGYNKHDAPPHTFESAVESGALKLDNFTNEELIGTFDALFACLVSWLEGNSMDQVLFTCLYLHQPSGIKDKALRYFCHAIRILIVIIKNIIIISSVNEEEDFQLYGNSSLLAVEDCQPTAVATQLKEAEDDLVRLSKTEQQPEYTMAVVHRLRFMRHFYQSIFLFDFVMGTAPQESNMNEIYKNLNASLELIPQIKRTIEKGIQPIPNSDSPNPIGFSPRIHDRSQPPTFPRNVKIRDRLSSLQFLEDLVHRLKYACKIIRMRDYYSALNFFIEFSKKSGQCVLSRSVLQGLFISNRRLVFGTIPIKDFLWDSVRAFNSPPVLNPKHPLASDQKIQMYLDTFFRYCISLNTFTQFIRICGFNRARQRDKLARFIDGFDTIQVEAARLDSHLTILANEKASEGNEAHATALKHSCQFATWVLYNSFRAMMLYLMSGFELELYSVHEFLYIYWYPYELLIGFIVSALTRTENNLLVQEEYAEHQSRLHGSSNSKNRKPKPKKNKKQQKPYRQEIVYYHAMLSMCGGYYKAMGALTKDGRIRQPMPKFDNEEIRFNRRFAPFATLTSPPPVSYAEFKSIREHMMRPPSSEIYAIAAKHFDQTRIVLESIQNPDQEILDMLHIAKVNSVVMNVLAKGHQKDSKTQPDFDFSKHRHFPIIKLN